MKKFFLGFLLLSTASLSWGEDQSISFLVTTLSTPTKRMLKQSKTSASQSSLHSVNLGSQKESLQVVEVPQTLLSLLVLADNSSSWKGLAEAIGSLRLLPHWETQTFGLACIQDTYGWEMSLLHLKILVHALCAELQLLTLNIFEPTQTSSQPIKRITTKGPNTRPKANPDCQPLSFPPSLSIKKVQAETISTKPIKPTTPNRSVTKYLCRDSAIPRWSDSVIAAQKTNQSTYGIFLNKKLEV